MTVKNKFGFGCMRLPLTDEKDPSSVDQEQFNKMVDLYMENGYNYFDTSYAYHNGISEISIKKAVVDRYPRKSYMIADKMPTWLLTKAEDNEKYVNEMLNRLGIDYFDRFLIHNINTPWCKKAVNAETFDYLRKMKEDGLASKIGFSFHDEPELLEKTLKEYSNGFDFALLEINYIDWNDPIIQSKKCYELCVEYGLEIYVMEPLKGGVILNTTEDIKNDFKKFNPNESIASLALRFCASLDNVKVILSGMSNIENTKENIETFNNFKVLTDEEWEFMEKEAEKLRKNIVVACSECDYCIEHCPHNIPISDYFRIYNAKKQNPDSNIYTAYYHKIANEEVSAEECNECGTCIDYCTQKIDIPEELKKVVETFESGFNPYA